MTVALVAGLEERFSLPREVVSPSAIFISIAIILVDIQPPKVWTVWM